MRLHLRDVWIPVLLGVGILQLGFVVLVAAHSALLEHALRPDADRAGEWVETSAKSRKAARKGRGIGHLEIPRLGLEAAVVEGVDDRSLLGGVGHVPGTAFPGERNNVALAGHRDTHFHPLRKIVRGDTIRVDTADGTFLYAVDRTYVVTPDRADLMKPTGRPMLTLVTCYPFGWIGTAPERFVVRAHGVTPRVTHAVARTGSLPAPRSRDGG